MPNEKFQKFFWTDIFRTFLKINEKKPKIFQMKNMVCYKISIGIYNICAIYCISTKVSKGHKNNKFTL